MPTHDEAQDQPSMTLAGKMAAKLVERKKGEGRLFLRDLLPRARAMSWARGRGGGRPGIQKGSRHVQKLLWDSAGKSGRTESERIKKFPKAASS